MRGHLEQTELSLGVDNTWVESRCERINGGGVCYRLPDQEVDKIFYRQWEAGLWSQGDYSHPDICWRNSTARHRQARKLLASTDGNLLTQVVEEPEGRGAWLNLVLTNKERWRLGAALEAETTGL